MACVPRAPPAYAHDPVQGRQHPQFRDCHVPADAPARWHLIESVEFGWSDAEVPPTEEEIDEFVKCFPIERHAAPGAQPEGGG